jgi:hypothetical protein
VGGVDHEHHVDHAADEKADALGDRLAVGAFVLRVLDGADELPQRVARQPQRDDEQGSDAERLGEDALHRAARARRLAGAEAERAHGRQRADDHVDHALGRVTEAGELRDERAGLVNGAADLGAGVAHGMTRVSCCHSALRKFDAADARDVRAPQPPGAAPR